MKNYLYFFALNVALLCSGQQIFAAAAADEDEFEEVQYEQAVQIGDPVASKILGWYKFDDTNTFQNGEMVPYRVNNVDFIWVQVFELPEPGLYTARTALNPRGYAVSVVPASSLGKKLKEGLLQVGGQNCMLCSQMLQIMQKQRWFEVLGVSELANLPEIKKAYRDLMRKYHPDKHPKKSPGCIKCFDELTKIITGAKKEADRKKQ